VLWLDKCKLRTRCRCLRVSRRQNTGSDPPVVSLDRISGQGVWDPHFHVGACSSRESYLQDQEDAWAKFRQEHPIPADALERLRGTQEELRRRSAWGWVFRPTPIWTRRSEAVLCRQSERSTGRRHKRVIPDGTRGAEVLQVAADDIGFSYPAMW